MGLGFLMSVGMVWSYGFVPALANAMVFLQLGFLMSVGLVWSPCVEDG